MDSKRWVFFFFSEMDSKRWIFFPFFFFENFDKAPTMPSFGCRGRWQCMNTYPQISHPDRVPEIPFFYSSKASVFISTCSFIIWPWLGNYWPYSILVEFIETLQTISSSLLAPSIWGIEIQSLLACTLPLFFHFKKWYALHILHGPEEYGWKESFQTIEVPVSYSHIYGKKNM